MAESDIIVYHRPELAHQGEWGQAFLEGLLAHGERAELRHAREPVPCGLAVMWSHGPAYVQHRRMQQAAGRRYLVLEHGFMGEREAWCSAAYDGLFGRADFCLPPWPDAVDGSRWDAQFAPAGLLRSVGEVGDPAGYALLCGQVRGDASVAHVNIERWYETTAKRLVAAGHTVRFRPHPIEAQRGRRDGPALARRIDGTLDEAFAGARLVVTFNSNTGVLAALAGLPVQVADPGGMAAPLGTGLVVEETLRRRWAERMAWCQWSAAELRDGTAWEYLQAGHTALPGGDDAA